MTGTPAPADPRSTLFVTFEGGEGSGKTTQIARAATFLRAHGRDVIVTREPGGSPGADALRHILLSGQAQALGSEMEPILFAAARADHVATLIRPALMRGQDVLCDRFHDSTRVYQGLSNDFDPDFLARLEEATVQDIYPDLTFILDIPAGEGLRRAAARRGDGAVDRFEAEATEIHEARRMGFLDIARREPKRCRVVDATRSVDAISDEIEAILRERFGLLNDELADVPEPVAR